METDINPYRSLNAEIDAIGFEKFCLETLKAYGQKEGLSDLTISHNQKIETHDSTYQIDIWAEYTALGCKNTEYWRTKSNPYFNFWLPS